MLVYYKKEIYFPPFFFITFFPFNELRNFKYILSWTNVFLDYYCFRGIWTNSQRFSSHDKWFSFLSHYYTNVDLCLLGTAEFVLKISNLALDLFKSAERRASREQLIWSKVVYLLFWQVVISDLFSMCDVCLCSCPMCLYTCMFHACAFACFPAVLGGLSLWMSSLPRVLNIHLFPFIPISFLSSWPFCFFYFSFFFFSLFLFQYRVMF